MDTVTTNIVSCTKLNKLLKHLCVTIFRVIVLLYIYVLLMLSASSIYDLLLTMEIDS